MSKAAFSIKTFIPTAGAGAEYFRSSMNLLQPTMHNEDLSVTAIMISDQILLARSWRVPYAEFDMEDSCLVRVVDHLIERGIAVEVPPSDHLDRQEAKELLGEFLSKVLEIMSRDLNVTLPEELAETALTNPDRFIEMIKDYQVPEGLHELSAGGLDIFLDAAFAHCLAGSICSRLHDPRNYVGLFRNMMAADTTGRPSDQDHIVDYVVGVVSETIPRVDILVSKDGAPAAPEIGPTAWGFVPIVGSYPDLGATMKRLEAILDMRDSALCQDLRELYRQTLSAAERFADSSALIIDRSQFHSQWALARAEMRRAFRLTERLEQWTDALVIPATIASFVFAPVGLLPLSTWVGAKVAKGRAHKAIRRKYPWLLLAEQLGDLAIEIRKQFAVEEL
jgi:hypothetical protein